MPKGDVVISEAEHEALKALLRAHKTVVDALDAMPDGGLRYVIRLPEVCRPLVFAATGHAVSVVPGGVAIEESVLTNEMLGRLESV